MFKVREHAYIYNLVRMHLDLLVAERGIENVVEELNEAGFLRGYWTIQDVTQFMWSGETPCYLETLCNAVLQMATQ